jgi:hypothetical protein
MNKFWLISLVDTSNDMFPCEVVPPYVCLIQPQIDFRGSFASKTPNFPKACLFATVALQWTSKSNRLT